jgi:hypothetical protein
MERAMMSRDVEAVRMFSEPCALRPLKHDQKRIRDYPVMNRMLANLFDATYASTLEGNSAKHGFMGPELVAAGIHGSPLDLSFWDKKIGSYRIWESFASCWGITIYVHPETIRDIFLPDTFILMTPDITFSIDISDDGYLKSIEMIFERMMPSFTLDLIRDFPGHNMKSDRVLSYILTKGKIGNGSLYLHKFRFNKVITIEV